MPPAMLPETGHENSACLQIAEACALADRCRGQDACRRLRCIQSCRCGLAILRAVTRRCLPGWQQQMLSEISLLLYRLSRCCPARSGDARIPKSPAADYRCDPCGESLFEKLEGIIGESLAQMNRGGRIDQGITRMGQLCRALSRYAHALEDQE